MPAMKIHEATRDDGTLAPVVLHVSDGALTIATDGGELALAPGAIEAVMERFGAPLEPRERLVEIGRVELPGGAILRHVRHLGRFDVIARDYLVYAPPDGEALCALAVTVSAALAHLARAAAR